MNRWWNLQLALILIVSLLCGYVMASDTRVTTMGGVNNVIIDDANMWLYPHTITKYPKLFNAEYSSGSDFSRIGGNFPLSDGSDPRVIGVYFYENAPIVFGPPGTNQPQFNGVDLPNHRLSLFYGQNLGGNPYGIALDYTSASEKSEAPGDETERSNFNLDLLVSGGVTEKLELAAGISFWDYKDIDAAGTDLVETSGNLLYQLFGRYWIRSTGNSMPVVHLGFANMTQTVDSVDYTDFLIELGMGFDYQAQEDILLVTDFGFIYLSDKISDAGTDTKSSFTALPYFRAGIDAALFKWLDFRAGVSSFWNSDKYEDVAKYKYVNTNTFLGAGFHWGKLDIDAQIQPEFLRNGPYFISGENTAGGIANRISAIFWFN